MAVEITIGVQNQTRELMVESDQSPDEVAAAVAAALDGGPALTLVDTRGRRVIVPTAVLGYVEIGSDLQRKVGFSSL
jgi:phage tail sheath gpL-like